MFRFSIVKNFIFGIRSKLKFGDIIKFPSIILSQPHNIKCPILLRSTATLLTARLLKINGPPVSKQKKYETMNTYEIEKEIINLVEEAESCVSRDDFRGARKYLNQALKIAEDTNVYGSVSLAYELLSGIALIEGNVAEAEDIIASYIEKLLQQGYPEDNPSLLKFKLKLARLYQNLGNRQLAEYGFRDCITILENKLKKDKNIDDISKLVYLNTLFWYGILLIDAKEFQNARANLKKALKQIEGGIAVTPAQLMVVLYYNSEVEIALKDYDKALTYMYNAIDVCSKQDKGNPDFAMYVVKVGEIYIMKKQYDMARFWCKSGKNIAESSLHKDGEKEAQDCLNKLDNVEKSKKVAASEKE